VKRIFELEVPEIYDKTVEIYKIVREPGYRTKIAVYSTREDVDPVGACVGLKGVRIQAIVRELEGEKVDILKYDTDPRVFIRNALSPAEVSQVIILDEGKRQALAVVPDSQLSLAIGKHGMNVRLANRLVDWTIDVKTESQFAEMDISAETKKAVSALFGEIGETVEEEEEISYISELPNIPAPIVEKLKSHNVELIEDLIELSNEELLKMGLTSEEIHTLRSILAETIEIVQEEPDKPLEAEKSPSEATEGEETYQCPECGATITLDMTTCPNCGVGLSFEIEEEGQQE
jgi:N utilization substance protein A